MQNKVENPVTTPIKPDDIRIKIRAIVNNYYDIQKLRIMVGGRLYASFARDEAEVDESVSEGVLKQVMDEYSRITDLLAEKYKSSGRSIPKAIRETDNITYIRTDIDYKMAEEYKTLLDQEKEVSKLVSKIVSQHPMWDRFFKDALGCGPLMAGVCISCFDIHKARHVSSFWSYAGVGTRPGKDGERVAMSRRSLVKRTYIDSEGREQTCDSIGYNSFLHDKLLGVLGGSFIKKTDSPYRKVYDDYKTRYMNREDWKRKDGTVSKDRCHRAAIRQAVKAFLRDLWVEWRTYEGYEVSEPYAVAVLGLAPHGYNEADGRAVAHND